MNKKNVWLALPMMVVANISHGAETENNEDLFAEEALPLVLSATRLRQSQQETPASVTIINRQQIEASGARSIVEVLRLVPGLDLGYSHQSTPEVSIHGLLTQFARRLQVLVDGQSVFKPGLSRVLWANLPLHIDEVERIEVVRGPNTSSYGSNAFLGVINIISRHPSDLEGHSASLALGSRGIADGSVHLTKQNDKLSYRLSAGYQQDDGFEGNSQTEARFDEMSRQYIRADLSYNPNLHDQWRLTLGHSEVTQQIDLLDTYQVNPHHPRETNDHSFQLNWQRQLGDEHTINFNGYYSSSMTYERWQSCPPALFLTDELGALYNLDPIYTDLFVEALIANVSPPTPPSTEVALAAQAALARALEFGTSTACGQANQDFDELKWGLEFTDTVKFNDTLRMVTGIGLRKDSIKGNSLFDGTPTNSTYHLFTNFEWRLNPQWLLNAGLLYEHDDFISGVISPRLALNYLASNKSSWRFISAKGVRTPDFYEQVGHRHYQAINLDTQINGTDDFATFYLTPQSMGMLIEETIISHEIGWNYRPNTKLNLDVRLFHETVKDGISGIQGLEDFNPQNNLAFSTQGVETQLEYNLSSQDKLWFSYGYLDHDSKQAFSTEEQMAHQTASLLYQHKFNDSSDYSVAYYRQDVLNRNNFERLDLRYGQRFNIANTNVNLDIVVQYRLTDDGFFRTDNIYADKTNAFLRARFNF